MMKTVQEKGCQGGEVQAKSRTTSASADSVGTNTSFVSATSNSLVNRRSPYTPVSNSPSQGRKSETKEIDKTDIPKKKNRRRERKRKPKLTNEAINTSAGSTPNSSPCFNKARSSATVNIPNPTNKSVGVNHQHIFPKTVALQGCAITKEKFKERQLQVTPKSKSSSKCTIESKFSYEIHPVETPQNGKAFRKRSKKHKYINLRTFLGLAKTCIFTTQIGQLSAAFKELTLRPKVKTKNRKYFDFVDNNVVVKENRAAIPPRVAEVKEHRHMTLTRTERDEVGNEIVQSVSFSEDSNVQIREERNEEHPSGVPKKNRKQRRDRHRLERKQAKEAQESFPPYITDEEARMGQESGELIRGCIRVNPKNSRDSYVSNTNSTLSDYQVISVADRNRALDGDEVLLQVKPEAEGQKGRKIATVVYILNKVHPRTTVGNLKPAPKGSDYAIFCPRDRRLPTMQILAVSCPNGFRNNPTLFANILFAGKLLEWPEPHKAIGVVTDVLGMSGDLRVETVAILKEFCLDTSPFTTDMVQYLPKSKDIPAEELEHREDIRKECVFTIDPLTARDLDDAVSVKELPNGNYEIGVHISDASYYLLEGTPLDKMVSSKATTIYLVDSVFHMLPVELCLHCSLLPGEDKLAFSVFWEMSEQGEVFSTRFARTVLNSCVQLAYEHAQQMIEDPKKEFKKEQLPKIMNGFTAKDLSKTVNVLQKIALNLREARVRNGSLRIDQVKLLFSLNPQNGEPLDFIVYENKEAHRLIEEFMLLANISVAKKINESFSDIAFLRCHEPPKYTMLAEAQRCLETCGIHIDISSSGGIHSSLRKYITDDYQGLCRGIVLNHVFAKPMTRARYFCAGTMDTEENYSHYALSVPIYTHFTSPIRRYADIMVHRLLAASLGYADKPTWDLDQVISIAANCNKQKYNAKRAGEASSDLYLAHYIEKNQPYVQDCVVVDVKERSFDAIVLKTGSQVRVYQRTCQGNPTWTVEAIPCGSDNQAEKSEHDKKVLRLIIDFPASKSAPEPHKMIVEMFTVVKMQLKRVPNTYKLEPCLLRPLLSRTFKRMDRDSSSSKEQS